MSIHWLNWFLGSLTVELWVGAWTMAFEGEIRQWWAARVLARGRSAWSG